MNWVKLKYIEFKNTEKIIKHDLYSLEKSYNYKVETKISDKHEIFVYIDLRKNYLNNFDNNKILYTLLNRLKSSLKFNKFYFNKCYNFFYNKKKININKDILINYQDNDTILLNDLNINLNTKSVASKEKKFMLLNVYILFNSTNNAEVISSICPKYKTLLISKKSYNFIDSINLIEFKKNYNKYINSGYKVLILENYLEYLTIKDYNIFKLLNSKVIFLENKFIRFTYELYCKFNTLFFNNNINNDLSLNTNFIKNNIINLSKINHYKVNDFWEIIIPKDNNFIIEKDEFYILRSLENIKIEDTIAAELEPFGDNFGNFRVHYAGFFDPGFGNTKLGTPAVFELRAYDTPFYVENKQKVARLNFYKLIEKSNNTYGNKIKSNYHNQKLKLAKQFKNVK